jgi:hypothetical protein
VLAKSVGNRFQIRIHSIVRLLRDIDAVCKHILERQLNTIFMAKDNTVSNDGRYCFSQADFCRTATQHLPANKYRVNNLDAAVSSHWRVGLNPLNKTLGPDGIITQAREKDFGVLCSRGLVQKRNNKIAHAGSRVYQMKVYKRQVGESSKIRHTSPMKFPIVAHCLPSARVIIVRSISMKCPR